MQTLLSLRPPRRHPFVFAGRERRITGARERVAALAPPSSDHRDSAVYVHGTRSARSGAESAKRQRAQSICVLKKRERNGASSPASAGTRTRRGGNNEASIRQRGRVEQDEGWRKQETDCFSSRRRRGGIVRETREKGKGSETSSRAERTLKEICSAAANLKCTYTRSGGPGAPSFPSFLQFSARCVSRLSIPQPSLPCISRQLPSGVLPPASLSSLFSPSLSSSRFLSPCSPSVSSFSPSFPLPRRSPTSLVSSGCGSPRGSAPRSADFRAAHFLRERSRSFSSSSARAASEHSRLLSDVSCSFFSRDSGVCLSSSAASASLASPPPSPSSFPSCPPYPPDSASSRSSTSEAPFDPQHESLLSPRSPSYWPFEEALEALAAQGVHTPDEQAQALGFASAPHLGLETLRRLSPHQEKLVFHWLLTGDPSPPADGKLNPPSSTSLSPLESASSLSLSPSSPPATVSSCSSSPPPSAGVSPPSLPACVLSCLHILEEEMLLKGLVISDLPRDVFFSHLREAALPQEIAAEEADRQKREAKESRREKAGSEWRDPGNFGGRFAQARNPRTQSPGVRTPQAQLRDGVGKQTDFGKPHSEPAADSTRRQELLNADWISARKKEIYGDNPYPFPLRWKNAFPRRPSSLSSSSSSAPTSSAGASGASFSSSVLLQERPSSCSSEEPLCILEKRQIIVERCVWARMLEEMEEQKAFLAGSLGSSDGASEALSVDRGVAKRVWYFWVGEMRTRIAALQEEQRALLTRFSRKLAADEEAEPSSAPGHDRDSTALETNGAGEGRSGDGVAKRQKKRKSEERNGGESCSSWSSLANDGDGLKKEIEAEKTLLPLDIDPTVLALITARTAVQLILVPTASSSVLPGKKGRGLGGDFAGSLEDEEVARHVESEEGSPLETPSTAGQAPTRLFPREREDVQMRAEPAWTVAAQRLAASRADSPDGPPAETERVPSSGEKGTAESDPGSEETPQKAEEVEATAAALIQNKTQRQVPVTQMAMAIGNAVNLEVNALRSESFFRGASGASLSPSFSSSSRLVLPQPRLFREHELLRKRAEGKTLDPRESRELQRLLATPNSHHEIWDLKKKLQVGGLLLGVLLRHAFVEADFAAAKRELAEELQQKEREKELIRRAQDKKQQLEVARDKRAGNNATDCTDTGDSVPKHTADAFAHGDPQATGGCEKSEKAKRKRGRPKPLFGTAFDSEDFAHLTVYRSRRSFTKVEVPAFFHRVIYNSKTQRFLGVIQMRRVCFSQLVSGQNYTSFFAPGKLAPPARGSSASPPASSLPSSSLTSHSPSASSSGGAPAPSASSSFRTLPAPPPQAASPSFWLFLKYLPMVLPPLPWQDYSRGAYLMLRNSFIRAVSYGEVKSAGRTSRKKDEESDEDEEDEDSSLASTEARATPAETSPKKGEKRAKGGGKREKIAFLGGAGRVKMARDFHAYNTALPRAVVSALGAQAWRINKDVLSVMEAAWQRGLEIGRLPPRDSAALDEEILQLRKVATDPGAGAASGASSAASIRLRHLLQQAGKLQSERPSFLLKLQVASCFQNLDAVYFPHNIDFRGRCYPLPPHLNHMGDDICRSLLVFAEPKPLGPNGLGWLKVHIANLFGVNKVSFADRQAWVDARLDQLLQVADDPLNPRSLHLLDQEADDPWQALSALLELKKVLAHGAENSAQFLSRLPIHQDGSCNGLQHYAALGRDRRGGEAVNLVGGEKPRDVYSFVLEVVKQRVHADAARGPGPEGLAPPEKRLAGLLMHHNLLQRKVVKQTVMTICYGVTAIGARDQVTRQLEDLIGETVDEATLKSLGGYLSRVVLSSIGEVFQSAMRLKKWLDEVSKMLNRLGLPVAWMLPLVQFGAEQPYRSGKALEVRTVLQTHIVRVAGEDTPTSASKQRLGFPPNFIHSLDATHMMLTARRCLLRRPPPLVPPSFSGAAGAGPGAWTACAEAENESDWRPMAFAAVHDSYWTHAGDVDRMRTVLRQEFVRLYSQPILEEFYEGLRARLGRVADDLPPPPSKGTLDINEVLHSDYFFH
ncbi:DNA-directed RNA polymerase,related [Neospora caninum Liverpool]|uniref:DNA-directed RNA polymerase n=1 Tax=Neospora caninum (strain Liverpool) TaxID=572307 RepID=F0VQ85_NEOCL|nr:DNA-directed RNA polymerase,related [Neospora caninum Liverpool]CBZ55882.1 DNA-directed RNA polymerase,related [Neospora caninum Liverpool]CEL70625.1 TPA: DNA-directed RNA polymerase, related [Neospora caninum Liverpool]|eukprot:XP_003885908.1 DNA-directed RNA polymerase,related [Neospora caninum Liverpool]